MKKRMIHSIAALCLIFVIAAISPSLSMKVPGGTQAQIIFPESQENLIAIPAEDTLEPILDKYLNSEIEEEPTVVVDYDVKTGIERKYTVNYDEIRSDANQLEPFEGNHYRALQEQSIQIETFSDSLGSSSPLDINDLKRVNDTDIFPWSAVVKIVGRLNATHRVWCSGAMISPNHVLTAGHCLYDLTADGWRSGVYVIPGKNGTETTILEEPFGRAYATHMRSTTGWTERASDMHDWAVITLDRDIGDETGWFGVKTLPFTHKNFSDRVYTAGYPAEYLSGEDMYNNSVVGGYADEFNHYLVGYFESGQSGSALWTYQNNSPYIISVYAWSTPMGTRLTQEKFDLMNLWLEQDESEEPQVDFVVAGTNNILSEINYIKTVYSLFTSFPITTQVQNHGNIAANKVTLGYFLSEDENITADDILIGKTTVRNLEPLELRVVSKTVRIPIGTPPGTYEIGWMIDPDNEHDEYFEDNNSFLNGLQLSVINSFMDQWLGNPLWLSLTIAGVVLAVGLPTVLGILRRRKRKQLAN